MLGVAEKRSMSLIVSKSNTHSVNLDRTPHERDRNNVENRVQHKEKKRERERERASVLRVATWYVECIHLLYPSTLVHSSLLLLCKRFRVNELQAF